MFFINGSSRWGNEFIQSIDSTITIENPIAHELKLRLRTGHGRLFWRCRELKNLEPETNQWINSFDKTDVFYDIGSNIGLFSLIAAQKIECKTYSFEVDPLNSAIQHENIFFNRLSDLITLLPFGLSDVTSIRSIFYKSISPGDALHSIDTPSPILDEKRKAQTTHMITPTFSLDSVIEMYSLDLPTHIKIDVDGAEQLILKGAKKTLASVQTIMIEVDKDSGELIHNLLLEHGFNHYEKFSAHGSDLNNYNVLYKR